MKPDSLGLDFVGGHRRSSRLGWSLLAAGSVLVLAAFVAWWLASEETAHWRQETLHWEEMAKGAGSGNRVADGQAALRPEVDAAAKAIDRLAIPWGELYGSLESSLDETIGLLAVLPNAEKGELRLNGEAKDFTALRGYLKRLSETGVLTEVRLLRQEIKQSDPQRPIVFSIVATWRSAT